MDGAFRPGDHARLALSSKFAAGVSRPEYLLCYATTSRQVNPDNRARHRHLDDRDDDGLQQAEHRTGAAGRRQRRAGRASLRRSRNRSGCRARTACSRSDCRHTRAPSTSTRSQSPSTNFLVFGYELIKGTSSDGSTKGDNLYPGPTLRVDPGEKLIVHYDNDLQGLDDRDFNDPAFTPQDGEVPIYPPALREAPLNLHTHGLHVSPSGNADNVLLSIPPGMGNTYDYAVPKNMPNGLYWYHSHRHTLTAQQTYMGLAGTAGDRASRRQPAAGHEEQHPGPRHGAAVQLRLRPQGRRPPAEQPVLAAVGQHAQAAARAPSSPTAPISRAWRR